jgi:hypothetical protein
MDTRIAVDERLVEWTPGPSIEPAPEVAVGPGRGRGRRTAPASHPGRPARGRLAMARLDVRGRRPLRLLPALRAARGGAGRGGRRARADSRGAGPGRPAGRRGHRRAVVAPRPAPAAHGRGSGQRSWQRGMDGPPDAGPHAPVAAVLRLVHRVVADPGADPGRDPAGRAYLRGPDGGRSVGRVAARHPEPARRAASTSRWPASAGSDETQVAVPARWSGGEVTVGLPDRPVGLAHPRAHDPDREDLRDARPADDRDRAAGPADVRGVRPARGDGVRARRGRRAARGTDPRPRGDRESRPSCRGSSTRQRRTSDRPRDDRPGSRTGRARRADRHLGHDGDPSRRSTASCRARRRSSGSRATDSS